MYYSLPSRKRTDSITTWHGNRVALTHGGGSLKRSLQPPTVLGIQIQWLHGLRARETSC